MKIGIDIDGVLVDTISCCADAISEFLGYKITCEDIIYRYEEMSEIHDFWTKNAERFLCSMPPIEGVSEHINELSKKHELFFISARHEILSDPSRNWLEEHRFPCENLFLLTGKSKTGLCKELGLNLFIEDSPKNAEEIVEIGIPVILIDTEYNMDFQDDRVIRAKNWGEVLKEIEKIIKPSLLGEGLIIYILLELS